MAQTHDYDLIEKFINGHVNRLQQKVELCTTELLSLSLSCPKTLLLSNLDSRLQEFVRLHHIELTKKVNYNVNKFKDHIQENKLFKGLSSYSLTKEQVVMSRFICNYI